MNVFSILCLLGCMIDIYLGLHVYYIDNRSKTNRLFFVLCFIQAVWLFVGIVFFSVESKEILWALYKTFFFVVIAYFVLMLHFCLVITNVIKIKPLYYALMYLPALVMFYGNATSNLLYKDAVWVNGNWQFILADPSPWLYVYLAYYHSYMIFSLMLLFLWNRRSRTIKDKRQSRLLFIALTLPLVFSFIEGLVVPALTSYRTFALAPLYSIIWMVGIWYAIVKYRFLVITPALVSNDIIANIDESIILADNESRIMTANEKTALLLGYFNAEIKSRGISDIIEEHDAIQKEIDEMSRNNRRSFCSRAHYVKKDGSRVLMDAKFKVVQDRFGDNLGVMIIGWEVKEEKQFRSMYRLTARQVEIIQYILQGRSNREIADSIGVAERTIKGHVTAIYHKLRVSNKMELYNLLKDFKLVPEHPAEKSLFLL